MRVSEGRQCAYYSSAGATPTVGVNARKLCHTILW